MDFELWQFCHNSEKTALPKTAYKNPPRKSQKPNVFLWFIDVSKLLLQSGVVNDIIWYVVAGGLLNLMLGFLKSEYGGEWLRPDGGEPSRMPRTPVGLVNHPAENCNWQLSVANGCLIQQPVLPDFACESGKGVK